MIDPQRNEPVERIRAHCQRACFVAPGCEPNDPNACPLCMTADYLQRVRGALDNCYMLARRERARLLRRTDVDPNFGDMLTKWEHVIRLCEQADCKSSILRRSLPTEMTEGEILRLETDY